VAQGPPVGQGLLIFGASRSHSDTPQSVGLLWMGDQPVAETSIRHAHTHTHTHKTLTRDRHQWPRRDSNPQSGQASGLRHTPYVARTLEIGGTLMLERVLVKFWCNSWVIFIIFVLRPINYRRYRPSVDMSRSVLPRFEIRNVSPVYEMVIKWATDTFDLGSSCLGRTLSWDFRRRSVFRGG
jgi:hypothetical protein